MKTRRFTLGLALLLAVAVAAPTLAQDVVRMDPVRPVLVPPLRDMDFAPVAPTGFNVEIPIRVVPGGSEIDNGIVFPGTQRELTGVNSPAPLVNFMGQSDDDNAATVGTRIVPPDTDGGVGPNHYVQWINLIAEIYDKNGNSVLGPFAGNAFFTGLGAPCATGNSGDPLTIYDQKNDRWVVSQFAPNQGRQCIAVSLTSDPTGSYWAYDVAVGGFNDYPKQGLWLNDTRDVLSLTYRNFGGPGGGISLDFQVLDYAAMLGGGAAASAIFRSGGAPFLEGTIPADVDGTTYPSGDQALFGRVSSNGAAYEVYGFDANFGGGVPTWNGLIDTASIGPIDRGIGRVPQPAPGEPLDDHSQFTMNRMAFREFGGYDQILVAASADSGGDVAAAYWAELRSNANGSTNFSAHQEGMYSPNNFGPRLERWMGSIAADKNGNIAYGYSASNSVAMPSVRYAGRKASDTLGILRDEIVAAAGGGVQTASANRWGDYSNMSVDPTDDCTFWYTTEYYANTGGFDFKTRIVSFRFDDCGATGTSPSISIVSGACGGTVTIQGTGFAPNSEVAIVRSPNTNGFIKGGPQCNSAIFEVGEPLVGGPFFAFPDASGNFSVGVSVPAGACLVEALDYGGGCETTGALDTSP